jgi:hypothetical protein
MVQELGIVGMGASLGFTQGQKFLLVIFMQEQFKYFCTLQAYADSIKFRTCPVIGVSCSSVRERVSPWWSFWWWWC